MGGEKNMIMKKRLKIDFRKAIFGLFFVMMMAIGGIFRGVSAYAEPVNNDATRLTVVAVENNDITEPTVVAPQSDNVTEPTVVVPGNTQTTEVQTSNGDTSCKKSLGALGWLVCPTTGKISEAVDWLYEKIEDILVINPIEVKDGSPIYEIWKYCRGITNIVFIIFLLVVIYSQLTGMGISNYGLKKVLPKLIVVAVLVNLSFLICSLAVDVSNIIGNGLRGVFTSVQESALTANGFTAGTKMSMSQMYSALAGGTALAIGGGVIAFELGAIWMLIPTVLGAIVAVASGLITIALRQAVVALLIMISPLAFVAYMLPNTEDLFKKWKKLFVRMLTFYPLFSLLFGASSLAGFALIASAKSGFGVLLGIAVQIFPLFFSWKLMQMSGTFLGDINTRMRGFAARPLAANRAWADSHRQLSRQRQLASDKAYTPSLRLMQFMSNRRIARDEELSEHAKNIKLRGQAYNVRRKYGKNGMPGRGAEEDYAMQAKNMEYEQIIERHKNNMNKGLGQLEVVKLGATTAQRARLNRLDVANVEAADSLFAEKMRGEKIEYDNAAGRHARFEAAINAHFDDLNGEKSKYKTHDMGDDERAVARAKYSTFSNIMEGSVQDIQFVAAGAAQSYDTQKKIVETKMQKYFELTPPTKDVEYRLGELTKLTTEELEKGKKVSENIDLILPGLRILNQRGDTDLLKNQLDNILAKNIGGGIELGTHASQSLASFLMFEVKDNDPFLRRFGKYINLETARAYNNNERKVMDVTYDEYIKGYHDGETELVSESNPTGRMYAKKGMKTLVEGTSLDNIERTALSNLDDSLKKAYGYDENDKDKAWDVAGWLRKREEIQTAFEPAFLSASLKWLSGSEQINSAVKFWTGYELKQKKDEEGHILTDENGDPIYDLAPVWNSKEFAGHEDEVERYYRRKATDYFKDQTTGQILGMRTDYRDANKEHMLKTYLEGLEDESDLTPKQREEYRRRQKEYADRKAEIQTRYGDKSPEEAAKLRNKDLKALDMEFSGRQIRKVLGETGKLKQIYRTRTSGTAINAKDWLRKWVNLDDEEALRQEMSFYDSKKKDRIVDEEKRKGADSEEEGSLGTGRVYTEEDRERFMDNMRDLKDRILDDETEIFFEETKSQLEEWFGEETFIVKKYEQYYRKDFPDADNIELYKFLQELLDDMNNYPDA